jgi:phage tail-like protein
MAGTKQAQNVSVTTWFLDASGTQLASFKTVSGISLELNVVEVQRRSPAARRRYEVGERRRREAGQAHLHPRLILDDSMWKWIQDTIDGNMVKARKNISIVLYDAMGKETKRYNFRNAFPSGWSLGDLDAAGTTR